MPSQRWFAAKGKPFERVTLREHACWSEQDDDWLLLWLNTEFRDGESQVYFIPISLAPAKPDSADLPTAWAIITGGARTSVLYDAFADLAFCQAFVRAMGKQREISIGDARLRFLATSAFPDPCQVCSDASKIDRLLAQGTNTVVRLDDQLFLKGYRRIREGRNPELEMGLYLTEVAPFTHMPSTAGALELCSEGDSNTTLCVAQRYVMNRGDAWGWTLNLLTRYLSAPREIERQRTLMAYLHAIQTLAQRTAELHRALAQSTQDPLFEPEPVERTDLFAWRDRLLRELSKTVARLYEVDNLPGRAQELADRFLAVQSKLQDRIVAHTPGKVVAFKSRYHGDYHLGQVLLLEDEDDFFIIDFEGEPARPYAERRKKDSALRDVAGMVRSFDYAAHSALSRIDPRHSHQREKLEPRLNKWRTRVTQAFLKSYMAALRGCPVCPRSPNDAQALIEWFTLEKALYEIRYELDHRPSWVAIPLHGALTLSEHFSIFVE